MDKDWCTIIDGKEIPNWVIKKPKERSEWEQFMAQAWNDVCATVCDFSKDPESWRERITNTPVVTNNEGENLFFDVYVSDDFILDHLKGAYKELDNEKNSPLPGLTLRQIISYIYDFATDGKTTPKRNT